MNPMVRASTAASGRSGEAGKREGREVQSARKDGGIAPVPETGWPLMPRNLILKASNPSHEPGVTITLEPYARNPAWLDRPPFTGRRCAGRRERVLRGG